MAGNRRKRKVVKVGTNRQGAMKQEKLKKEIEKGIDLKKVRTKRLWLDVRPLLYRIYYFRFGGQRVVGLQVFPPDNMRLKSAICILKVSTY